MYRTQQEAECMRQPVTRHDRSFDALNWNLCSDTGTTNRAARGQFDCTLLKKIGSKHLEFIKAEL